LVDSPLLPAEFKGKALPIDEFVSSATEQLLQDVTEIGYKSDNIIRGSRDDLDAQFREWNDWSEKLKMSHTSSQQSQHSQSSQKKEMMWSCCETGWAGIVWGSASHIPFIFYFTCSPPTNVGVSVINFAKKKVLSLNVVFQNRTINKAVDFLELNCNCESCIMCE